MVQVEAEGEQREAEKGDHSRRSFQSSIASSSQRSRSAHRQPSCAPTTRPHSSHVSHSHGVRPQPSQQRHCVRPQPPVQGGSVG